MKLLVWEDSGEIRIKQQFGKITPKQHDKLIDRYAEQGKTARPFKAVDHPVGHIFWDGKKIKLRPQLRARLDKATVRVGDTAKIIGVPAGSYVVIRDAFNSERLGPTKGGAIQMHMQDAGRRVIEIHAFPHLHQTLHLNVE